MSTPATQTLANLLGDNLSVRMMGAVGDGLTDDRTAFGASVVGALAAADAVGSDSISLIVPNGKYFLGSFDPAYPAGAALSAHIIVDGGSGAMRRLKIIGRGATIVTALHPTSSSDLSTILYVTGNLTVEISGFKFINTHPPTSGDTCAVRLWGGTGLTLKQPHVHHCEFRNFSRPLSVGGYDVLDVDNCQFLWDLGRDSGTLAGNPCVGIWAGADQVANPANNTRVHKCYFNGCMNGSISAFATQKWSADGLVYGQSKGWCVTENIVVNHAFEAIYIQARIGESGEPTPPAETTRYPCEIRGNIIDDAQPSGTVFTGPGSPDIVTIRCEESEALVDDNTGRSVVNGIVGDGINVGTPSVVRNLKVSRNRLFMLQGSDGNCFQGMYFNNTSNLEVTDNLVCFDGAAGTGSTAWNNGLAGIALGDANTGPILLDNIVRDDDPGATTTPIYSYWIQQSTGFLFDRNQSIGTQFGINSVNTGPIPSGIINTHTWLNVATPLSGNFTSILLALQSVTFTPTAGATGWYTILLVPAALASASGRLFISTPTSPLYDNTVTDIGIDFNVAGYGQDCTFIETRYQNYNGGVISAIRASNTTPGGAVQVDIQVSTATAPEPITLTLVQSQVGILLVQAPAVGATPLANVFQLTCGEGLRTNSGLSVMKAAGFGTTSPTDPLHVFRANGTQSNMCVEQASQAAWRVGMAASSPNLRIATTSGLTSPYVEFVPGTGLILYNQVTLPSLAGTGTRVVGADASGDLVITSVAGGITQLTGDVTAGPGSGSQASTVGKLQGSVVLSGTPSSGEALVATSSTAASWQAVSPTFPAWTPYSPSVGNLSSPSVAASGQQSGKTAFVRIVVSGTSNGSLPTVTLPYAPLDNNQAFAVQVFGTGKFLPAAVAVSGSTLQVNLANSVTFSLGVSYEIWIQGVYETS